GNKTLFPFPSSLLSDPPKFVRSKPSFEFPRSQFCGRPWIQEGAGETGYDRHRGSTGHAAQGGAGDVGSLAGRCLGFLPPPCGSPSPMGRSGHLDEKGIFYVSMVIRFHIDRSPLGSQGLKHLVNSKRGTAPKSLFLLAPETN
ncbi:unnamed protein product, partial [Musa banksii]